MTAALTVYGQFDTLQRAAMALHESGYFNDSKSKAQAVVKVMAGAELGLPPFASMTGIHIIQGKPALGANVIATLIKNDPRYNYRVLVMEDDVCRIQFYENGEPCGISEFTATDAQKAQVRNMNKFPRNMLFARAISNGAKWYAPGIFGGSPVYTPDELGVDYDEEGYVVESHVVDATFDQTDPLGDDDFNQDVEQSIKEIDRKHDESPDYDKDGKLIDSAYMAVMDTRASLEEYQRMTGIQVADAAIQTGHYNSREHVEATLKKHHEGFRKSGGKLSAGVDRAIALEWFDALMQHSETAEAA